jgi:predicted sulfurtransferase
MTKVEELRQAAKEKKRNRQSYIEIDRQRNLELKRLIYDNNQHESEAASSLIAVRVSVDDSLRRSLAMNGREKRGRMFLRYGQGSGMTTLAEFKQELHGFFRTLKRKSYILQAALPSRGMDSPWNATGDNTVIQDSAIAWWPLESDEHIVQTLKRANEYFLLLQQESINSSSTTEAKKVLVMKRPTFLLRVSQDPNYVPPSEPAYFVNMPDPSDSNTMTMISFYSFFPIQDEIEFVANLKRVWKPFHALGRVYVAKEGINAQMAVPTNVLAQFRQSLMDVIPEAVTNTDIVNVDPVPIEKSDFFNESHSPPPFTNLHIRIRPQIVADGIPLESNNITDPKPLDLYGHSTGVEMSPLDWHESISLLQNQQSGSADTTQPCQKQVPIVLDCRNKYETDVGTFVGAEPLNTEFFRESWDVLKERLRDTPKDAPILTYCTGGRYS